MLHPVTWPNHGPKIEHYLAEEAIGLVKSLSWDVSKGPMWELTQNDSDDEADSDDENNQLRQELSDEPMTFNT